MQKKIKLDPRQLLGFRVAGFKRTQVTLGGKLGEKTGNG